MSFPLTKQLEKNVLLAVFSTTMIVMSSCSSPVSAPRTVHKIKRSVATPKIDSKKEASKKIKSTLKKAISSPKVVIKTGIRDVPKVDFSDLPVLKPRVQPAVPQGFKESVPTEKTTQLKPTAEEKTRGYVVFSRAITQAVYKNTKPQNWERSKVLTAFGTPGEYEPITFSLFPLRKIGNLRLKVSSLRSNDSEIDKSNLDLRAVTYWNMRYPMYTTNGIYRAIPELLERVNSIRLFKDKSQRFWIRIHIPKGTKPGIYQGVVTLYETGKDKCVEIPIAIRVLSYSLQKDPKKHYSAYYYSPNYQFPGIHGKELEQAQLNEFKTMRAYGLDICPVVGIGSKTDMKGNIELYLKDDSAIRLMVKAGLKGPVPISGGIAPFYKKYVPKGKIGKHWHVTKMPSSDKIYKAIERAFRKLKKESAKKGLPELICCPMDEVDSSSAEFAAKVYAAIRRAGVKTFITKSPTAPDAAIYRKYNGIDAWCSQSFSVPYEHVIHDKSVEYWCYPNHNAGELKNPVIMQKGGRMTYGFGLWRSGFTTLIPWHWRWRTGRSVPPFNYLAGKRSGCGVRVDDHYDVIPTPYWECFREGVDDLRYLYTLQTAIVQREGTADPTCQKLIVAGKKLIQDIWDSIEPQQKYLNTGMWEDSTFNARRWEIAALTEKLLAYPATNNKVAPSVLAMDTKAPIKEGRSFIDESIKKGYIDRFDLGQNQYGNWKSNEKEVSLKVTRDKNGKSIMHYTVVVDHKVDGRDPINGHYKVGWPKIFYPFKRHQLDLTKYDYLYFNYRINSNRDEVSDDHTPFVINIKTYGGVKYDKKIDLGGKQRVWLNKILSIKDLITVSGKSKTEWKNLKLLQFVIFERLYTDKTKLMFELSDIAFLKFNRPVIKTVESADVVLLPTNDYIIDISGFGFEQATVDKDTIIATLTDKAGNVVVTKAQPMTLNPMFILDFKSLKPGQYKLEITVRNNDNILSSKIKTIKLLHSYL